MLNGVSFSSCTMPWILSIRIIVWLRAKRRMCWPHTHVPCTANDKELDVCCVHRCRLLVLQFAKRFCEFLTPNKLSIHFGSEIPIKHSFQSNTNMFRFHLRHQDQWARSMIRDARLTEMRNMFVRNMQWNHSWGETKWCRNILNKRWTNKKIWTTLNRPNWEYYSFARMQVDIIAYSALYFGCVARYDGKHVRIHTADEMRWAWTHRSTGQKC